MASLNTHINSLCLALHHASMPITIMRIRSSSSPALSGLNELLVYTHTVAVAAVIQHNGCKSYTSTTIFPPLECH